MRGLMVCGARVCLIAGGVIGATACLWAQRAADMQAQTQAQALTTETHLSLGLLVSFIGIGIGLVVQIVTSQRAFARLQQSVEDHHKEPHMTQADVEAKAVFWAANYASKEVCAERHAALDSRLERIEQALNNLSTAIQSIATQVAKLAH